MTSVSPPGTHPEFAGYEPGATETVWVLDVEGSPVVASTRVNADASPAARAEFDAVLNSIRITRAP